MNKNDGGPAFPNELQFDQHGACANSHAIAYGGMSLRDYFAAKAMAAFIALNSEGGGRPGYASTAAHAYEYADAMIAERAE